MDDIKTALVARGFKGELDDGPTILDAFSHDASLFEIRPKLVAAPTNAKDVQMLVSLVAERKKFIPHLSLTARSAGTDMSCGAINESVLVDFRRYFTNIEAMSENAARVH